MSPEDDEPYSDPIRPLRDSGWAIYLNLVDGVPWATDSYWAVEMPDEKHWLARLLHRYNVPYDQPATVRIEGTLVLAEDTEPKDLKALVIEKLPEGLERVEKRLLNSAPLFVSNGEADPRHAIWYALYDLPGGKVGVVNRELVRLVERMTPPEAEWFAGPDPKKPMVRKVGDHIVGVLMPVTHMVNGTNA